MDARLGWISNIKRGESFVARKISRNCKLSETLRLSITRTQSGNCVYHKSSREGDATDVWRKHYVRIPWGREIHYVSLSIGERNEPHVRFRRPSRRTTYLSIKALSRDFRFRVGLHTRRPMHTWKLHKKSYLQCMTDDKVKRGAT